MNFMVKFGERLTEFMEEKNLNAPALAKILQIDRSNVTRYMRGERTPNFKTFIAMLAVFDCSADYLLGLVDYPPSNTVFQEPDQQFNARLRYVIDCCGQSQYSLDKKAGISNSAIYYWLSGKKYPSLSSLIDLSKNLDCSVDFILGREK